MNYITVIVFAIVIISIAKFIRKTKNNSKQSSEEGIEEPFQEGIVEDDNMIEKDLDEDFFNKLGTDKIISIVKVFNPNDLNIIREILYAYDIPSYSPVEHTSALFPGVRIAGYTDSVIQIRSSDVIKSTELIKEYIEYRKGKIEINQDSKLRNVAETIIGGFVVSGASVGSLPELLYEEK